MDAFDRRIPVEHPAFRYPPSTNPYWSRIRGLKDRVFLDNDPEALKGRWKTHLTELLGHEPKKTVLEIGCNGAHVLRGWAQRDPESAFIGVDWKFKQIYFAYEKAIKHNIQNLILLRTHAQRLKYIFGPGEIDEIHLLFSDPWPKTAHWHNRLVQAPWLDGIAPLLSDQGWMEIRTDHPGYFDWMKSELGKTNSPWQIVQESRNYYEGHPNPRLLDIPDVTLFEKIFIREGIAIHRLRLNRPQQVRSANGNSEHRHKLV